MKFNSFGWVLGYFVLFAPINMTLHHTSLVYALAHAIFGLGVAVVIETVSQRDRRYF